LAAVVSIEGLPNEEVTTDEVVYDGSVAEECHLIKDPTELDIANLSDSDASEDEEADAAGPLLKADAPTYPGKILLLKYRLAVICAVALFKPRAKVKKKNSPPRLPSSGPSPVNDAKGCRCGYSINDS